jgi:hypothetical protein
LIPNVATAVATSRPKQGKRAVQTRVAARSRFPVFRAISSRSQFSRRSDHRRPREPVLTTEAAHEVRFAPSLPTTPSS